MTASSADRPTVYAFAGRIPVVRPGAYVHPSAVLIGDVVVGAGCYIGPGASLRGDFGHILVDEGANVQDNCVLHCFPGRSVVVERDGHIGHGAVLHGCRIGRNALVGMKAVVMDDVVVGEEAFVAATAFLPANRTYPPRVLIRGAPAEIVRELSAEEIAWKGRGTAAYQRLAAECLTGLHATAALSEPPGSSPQGAEPALAPLWQHRRDRAE